MAGWNENICNFVPQQVKTLYLHYHNAYGYQTWQGGDLPYGAPTHKITGHFGQVVLEDHVSNKSNCISTIRVPMVTKLGRMVTYFERIQTIKSFYALIAWPWKVMWQTKLIYPQPEYLWLQTWQNDNLPWRVPIYKVTSPFDHMVLQDHVAN